MEGEFTGLASHEFDVALLLQNWRELLDGTTNNAGTQMTDQWIKYVNGEPWSTTGQILVIGPQGITQMGEEQYDHEYRAGNGKVLLDLGLGKCFRVAEDWAGVRVEIEEDNTNGSL